VDMLAQIGDILPRFRIYERLYHNHERLLVALSKAYLDVIHFCTRTKDFFLNAKRSMSESVMSVTVSVVANVNSVPLSIVLKGAWKPFRVDFSQHMIAFRQHSTRIEDEARLAHRIEATRMYEIQLANRALQVRNSKLQKRNSILSALPSVDYLGKYSKFLNRRHPGTNIWLFSTAKYMSWKAAPASDCLCCYGIPGSGKSVLASSVVEALKASKQSDSSIVCQYYCDYADVASLDPYCLMGSLLKQVLQYISLDSFTDDFLCPFQEGKALPSPDIVSEFLIQTLRGFRAVYFILDGIDEMSQENQPTVLALIETLLRQHPNLKLFVTSRIEEYWIRKALEPYGTVRLSHACIRDDVALFVEDCLTKAVGSGPIKDNEKLKDDVLEALLLGANGM
jgi:hypothetical protein